MRRTIVFFAGIIFFGTSFSSCTHNQNSVTKSYTFGVKIAPTQPAGDNVEIVISNNNPFEICISNDLTSNPMTYAMDINLKKNGIVQKKRDFGIVQIPVPGEQIIAINEEIRGTYVFLRRFVAGNFSKDDKIEMSVKFQFWDCVDRSFHEYKSPYKKIAGLTAITMTQLAEITATRAITPK
jgi:hypothetical protein